MLSLQGVWVQSLVRELRSCTLQSVVKTNKHTKKTEWIRKHDPTTCCLHEIHFNYNNRGRLNIKEWRKIHFAKISSKKTEATFISNKVDFKTRNVNTD